MEERKIGSNLWNMSGNDSTGADEIVGVIRPIPFRFNSSQIRKIKNKHYKGFLITEVGQSSLGPKAGK